MKIRLTSFYVDQGQVTEALRIIGDEILPRFRSLPQFVELVVLYAQDEGVRGEILGLSFRDDDLGDFDSQVVEIRKIVSNVSGTSMSTKLYNVLRQSPATR